MKSWTGFLLLFHFSLTLKVKVVDHKFLILPNVSNYLGPFLFDLENQFDQSLDSILYIKCSKFVKKKLKFENLSFDFCSESPKKLSIIELNKIMKNL